MRENNLERVVISFTAEQYISTIAEKLCDAGNNYSVSSAYNQARQVNYFDIEKIFFNDLEYITER